jgi:hypothetical protein
LIDLILFEGEDHDAGGKVRLTVPDHVISEAIYSPCRQYRYILHRRWESDRPDRSLMFLMLNPSTATEEMDDPTVRKCRHYAMRWGYNHLIVGNLMAYRATDPILLRGIDDPIGPDNYQHLRDAIETYAPMLICAWGCLPGRLLHVESPVRDLLRELVVQPQALRLNAAGSPGHPLYVAMDVVPLDYIV